MKKILVLLLIIGAFTTSSVFAYNKNIELNTEEYINLINTNMTELKDKIEIKEKANLGTILLNGIEEGYIIPSINNDIKLKEGITELINNIKDVKIYNKNLQNKHDELILKLNSLTELVNVSIKCKKEILNSNDKKLVKGQRLLQEDDKKIDIINNKIEEINDLYKEINNFAPDNRNPRV